MAFESMLAPRRSCEDVKRFLAGYDTFRAENPLPENWTEDRSDLLTAITDPDHEPVLRFEQTMQKGSVRVEVDLFSQRFISLRVLDTTGNPSDKERVVDIMRILLGDHTDVGEVTFNDQETGFLPPTEFDPTAPDDEPEAYCRVPERPC